MFIFGPISYVRRTSGCRIRSVGLRGVDRDQLAVGPVRGFDVDVVLETEITSISARLIDPSGGVVAEFHAEYFLVVERQRRGREFQMPTQSSGEDDNPVKVRCLVGSQPRNLELAHLFQRYGLVAKRPIRQGLSADPPFDADWSQQRIASVNQFESC